MRPAPDRVSRHERLRVWLEGDKLPAGTWAADDGGVRWWNAGAVVHPGAGPIVEVVVPDSEAYAAAVATERERRRIVAEIVAQLHELEAAVEAGPQDPHPLAEAVRIGSEIDSPALACPESSEPGSAPYDPSGLDCGASERDGRGVS